MLQSAFMIVAAGVVSGTTGEAMSSGGAKFGGGGATGSW
jgi:uncharacterized membrane protein YgcG